MTANEVFWIFSSGLALVWLSGNLITGRARKTKTAEVRALLWKLTDPLGRADADEIYGTVRDIMRFYGIVPDDVGFRNFREIGRSAETSLRLSYWRILRRNDEIADSLDALRCIPEGHRTRDDNADLACLREALISSGGALNELHRRLKRFRQTVKSLPA